MDELAKVEIQKLELSDDGYGDALLEGAPFNGIAFERDAASGQLLSLTGYRMGRLHGAFRSWYRSRGLRCEIFYHNGGYHGPFREWHEDGQLAREALWEHNVRLSERVWDAEGRLLSEREHPAPSAMAELVARRAEHGDAAPIIDIDVERWEFVKRPWRAE